MKKLICLVLSLCFLVGCQGKTIPTKQLDKFLEYYYEVTPEQVEELKDFYSKAPTDDTRMDYLSKEEDLSIYAIKEVCTETFKERFFNSREYNFYINKFEDQGISHLEVKESNYEEDYDSDDYIYYVHQTKVDVHYLDGTTKETSIEGRICIDKKTNLVHTYKETKALELTSLN